MKEEFENNPIYQNVLIKNSNFKFAIIAVYVDN